MQTILKSFARSKRLTIHAVSNSDIPAGSAATACHTMKRTGNSTHPCSQGCGAGAKAILDGWSRSQKIFRWWIRSPKFGFRFKRVIQTIQCFFYFLGQVVLESEGENAFMRSTKHMQTSLANSQDFSKLRWREKICLWCYGREKTALSIVQHKVPLSRSSFFQGT